eukprot:Nitzschia sp. Nitz4//scaffold137_size62074//51311//57656//NITZ4_006427-RA/size62074-snap-gene-0.20-mRNA-1//1//CDS//3329535736//3386//frame0
MGRFNGTLHKLVDGACTTNSKTKWNQVIHYLEGHTIANNDATNPRFDSPLPPYSSPTLELEAELLDGQGPKREDTPLKIAVRSAPAVVIAALCHLAPGAVKIADSRDRLPIHWACRRPADDSETEQVISILVKAAPETLIHRDDGGRTPLHYTFWYHTQLRSLGLIKFLCQELPPRCIRDIKQPRDSQNERYPLPPIPVPDGKTEGIPSNASIVPDARHGALPIHYAVMQGASKDVLKLLISIYPNSLSYGDRKGRTPLAWYLGAGHLLDNNKRHVCGEANDPNAIPWWHVKLSPAVVQILVSSKVARATDDMNRTPLHWAAHFYARSMLALEQSSLSVKIIQTLVDNNVEAVIVQDCDGNTPLHVLFAVVAEQQNLEHQRLVANRTVRSDLDLFQGGPIGFVPPKDLVELFLKLPEADGLEPAYRFETGRDDKKPPSSSHVEDVNGLLPLHAALRVAADPETIRLLIQSNPTSLIHASEEELQTPLAQAFCSEYTTPFQTTQMFDLLMAAYVTSRHGTFIDGRVALKMEDASGAYPIHHACQNLACLGIIQVFVEKFPHCAHHQNAEGDLPLHLLLSRECLFDRPHNGVLRGATLAKSFAGLQTEKEIEWEQKLKNVYREKMKCLINPLLSPQQLKIASSAHGMTPLHVAVGFRAVPYTTIYRMLDIYPDAATMLTTAKGYNFSCMDLHEMTRDEAEDSEEWDAIQELLFAFNPMLDEYRRKDELLEACVRLIRKELAGQGSYHLSNIPGKFDAGAHDIQIKDTLSSIAMPEIDVAYRPQTRKRKDDTVKITKKITKKKGTALNLTNTFSFGGQKKKQVEKSIYDDDLGERYVVSPANSGDEDDDEEFLSSEEEEEYLSGSDDSGMGSSFDDQSTHRSSWDQDLGNGPSGTLTDSFSHNSGISPGSPTSSPAKMSSPSKVVQSVGSHIEEKKEESVETPRPRGVVLSDTAMRLFCFFVLYNDVRNPEDNYIAQVEEITDEQTYDVLEQLMNLPVPPYALKYLEKGTNAAGLTLRDAACPTSKALFRSFQYFLGKYEFPAELDSILLHRNSDGNTVYVKAIEHVIRTKEYLPKQEFEPGEAEETIWATGSKVEEEGGYMASKFVDKKRFVCFKLTRNQEAYDNEVLCRNHLGVASGEPTLSNVLPLLNDFVATEATKKGRKYLMDVNDERFQTLQLFGGESVELSDFHYALIYPYSDEGDLFDYFFHHGVDGMEDVSAIAKQVAAALRMMHEKGIVHGNISMRHIKMVPLEDESTHRTWAVSDFSTATRSQNQSAFMGTISHNGSAQFATGLLPPEMFVKLSAAEARIYKTYWEMVERLHGVKVDKAVVEPFVNLNTGATYVIRCHYVPDSGTQLDSSLPELPYQLVPSRESTDVWCFGLMLFSLCSGGRPLFPSNLKTGHLLDYESIVGWDEDRAASIIYEHVQDPVAQDLLLHLLTTYDKRVDLSMEAVINHPFLKRAAEGSQVLAKMIDMRQTESVAHDRRRQLVVTAKSEGNWLDGRTTEVKCWNFDLLRKFNFSSTEIVGKLLKEKEKALSMPCSFILLPYKLSAKNKKAKLAPTTKKDVERAERMGVLLLQLGKACFLGCRIVDVLKQHEGEQWTASKVLEYLTLSDDYLSLKDEFTKLAASHVESFRVDPTSTVHKLIQRQITEIRKFFKDSGKAFLYLVDEYAGIPLVGSTYSPYPLEVSDSILDKFLVRALPFMHICVMNAHALAGSISGVVRLIFEAAYPHVPPSWAVAGAGLPRTLEEALIISEVRMLRDSLDLLYTSKGNNMDDDLRFIRDSCLKIDTRGIFAQMQRVLSAGSSIWTTLEGAAEIQNTCQSFGFQSALEIQSSLEEKLRAQEIQIKQLQEEVEKLSFRRKLNLDVPEASTSTRQIANKSGGVPLVVTTPGKDTTTQQGSLPAMTPKTANTTLSPKAVVASPTDTSTIYEEFYDTKDAPSFDESRKTAEERTQQGSTRQVGADDSTCKSSEVDSLRERV